MIATEKDARLEARRKQVDAHLSLCRSLASEQQELGPDRTLEHPQAEASRNVDCAKMSASMLGMRKATCQQCADGLQ